MIGSRFLIAIFLTVSVAAQAQTVYQFKNRWKSEEYINVEQPNPSSGSIQPDWLSAQWTVEPVGTTGYYTIKNAWRNEYLHIESGPLTSGDIQQAWWSAHWSLEPVDGTSFYRIRNRWKPEVAIHNQNGKLEAGPIDLGWWSAQWSTVNVKAADPTLNVTVKEPAPPTERRSNNPNAFKPEHNGRIETAVVRYTDQIYLIGNTPLKKGNKIFFFKQEVVDLNAAGLSFDPKNPAIGGQEFTVVETEPKLKLDRPMPMMRNTNNSSFSLVVEVY